MKKIKKEINIKNRIIILLIMFCLLIGGCNILISLYKNELILSNLEEYSNNQIRLLNRELEFKFHILEKMASDITDVNNLKQYVVELNEISTTNSYWKMGIVDSNGKGYLNSGKEVDVSERSYFKEGIKGKRYISGVIKDKEFDCNINVYSVPIYDEQKEVKGIVFLVLRSEDFTNLIQIQVDVPDRYSYIIEPDGALITLSELSDSLEMTNFLDELEEIEKNDEHRRIIEEGIESGQPGMIRVHHNEEKYTYYASIGINNWYLVTFMTEEVLLYQIAPFIRLTQIMMLTFSIVFIIAFLWNLLNFFSHKKHIETIAWSDELTKGKNKAYLRENIPLLIDNQKHLNAVLININIHNFRSINDLYTIRIGNEILIKVYNIILSQCKEKEEVVHTYADEFLMLWFYKDIDEINLRLEKLKQLLSKIEIGDSVFHIRVLAGLANVEEASDFDVLYSRSMMARKKCKEINQETYLFEENLIKDLLDKNNLEKEIKEAIANKEFEAFFQPQVCSFTETIIGAEALVRWRKKDGTLVPPFQFIPYAEQNGLIQQIDEVIFQDVCKKMKKYLQCGIQIPVSVNISRAYIKNTTYLKKLKKIAEQYGIPTNLIHLEITESGFLDDEKVLSNVFEEIKSWGFITSLDDFGTGYSSVKTLNDFAFDILKIDKSFVDKIGDKRTDNVILHIINLAKSFHMQIIAEGIETQEQFEFLKKNGCEMIQGYYFSKPVEFDVFFHMIKKDRK